LTATAASPRAVDAETRGSDGAGAAIIEPHGLLPGFADVLADDGPRLTQGAPRPVVQTHERHSFTDRVILAHGPPPYFKVRDAGWAGVLNGDLNIQVGWRQDAAYPFR
jgi:hypothetical protein